MLSGTALTKNDIQTTSWQTSTEGTAVFVADSEVVDFARNLMAGSEVLIELTDYKGTKHQQKFPLNGSTKAISSVMEACGTSPKGKTIQMDPNRVTALTKEVVGKWTTKQATCNVASLNALGYQAGIPGAKVGPDTYYAMQSFFDKTYLEQCGPDTKPAYEKSTDCQSREVFASGRVFRLLQDYASNKDSAIGKYCP